MIEVFEKSGTFNSSELPDWYTESNEPKSRAGTKLGLSVLLDLHTERAEPLSFNSDFSGFTVVIGNYHEYPLTFQKGIQIRPGNHIGLSLEATKINADDGIRTISIKDRKCMYADENFNLTYHKTYSQASCFLECQMAIGKKKMVGKGGAGRPCIPWYLPKIDEKTCLPWEAVEFEKIMTSVVLEDDCPHCYPDCIFVRYSAVSSMASRNFTFFDFFPKIFGENSGRRFIILAN